MKKVIDINQYLKTKHIKEEYKSFYMMVGLPCSGKSTYSLELSRKNNAIIVSSDNIREELLINNVYKKQDNENIFNVVYNRIYYYLNINRDIIFDATNTNRIYREHYVKLVQKYNYKVIAIVFNTPIEVCIERNKYRNKATKVTKRKMLEIKKYFDKPSIDEGFNEIIYI